MSSYLLYVLLLSLLWESLLSSSIGDESTAANNVRITVVCMQRNEVDMLDYWFRYYTRLVGIDNVLLLDNNSTDIKALQILQYWEKQGVTVLYNVGPYRRKPYLLLDMARQYKPLGKVLLVTDVDEFLVSFPKRILTVQGSDDGVVNPNHSDGSHDISGESYTSSLSVSVDADRNGFDSITVNKRYPHLIPTFRRSDIRNQLAQFYYGPHAALKLLPSYLSVPVARASTFDNASTISISTVADHAATMVEVNDLTLFEVFHYSPEHCKIVYKLSTVLKLDHGNHHVHTRRRGSTHQTTRQLGFLHFHSRDPRGLVERAIRNAHELKQLSTKCTFNTMSPLASHISVNISKSDTRINHTQSEEQQALHVYNYCKQLLEALTNVPTTQGREKLMEIQQYMTYGVGYFLMPMPGGGRDVGGTSNNTNSKNENKLAEDTDNLYTSISRQRQRQRRNYRFVSLPPIEEIIRKLYE